MSMAMKVIAAGALALALVLLVNVATRNDHPTNGKGAELLAGMTLDQITERMKSCGETGKSLHEKLKTGAATTAERTTFEDCRRFVFAARDFLSGGGAILIDAESGKIKSPQ